jgi:arylsulfatase A-like enzyme
MYMHEEEHQPQANTFARGLEFIRTNHKSDKWFLHIETFDPHEPFFTQEEYKQLYPHEYDGPHFDWPSYGRVKETDEQVLHIRYEYAALVSMCDKYLGQVLDILDELDLWSDTMLIVNTDHGFSLGDRGWWGKSVQPFYNEIAHIPLFVWDPRSNRCGVRSKNFVQMIDLAPTLLEYFGAEIPPSMQGVPLGDAIPGGIATFI